MSNLQTTAELEQMLRDTGGWKVGTEWDETYGHFEILDEVITSESDVLVAVPSLLIATGALENLAMDTQLTVIDPDTEEETEYTVRDYRRVEDGMLTRILLKAA